MKKVAPSDQNRLARQQLAHHFRTAADLDAFCLDYFPQVKARFSDGMERLGRINLLLEIVGAEAILHALGQASLIATPRANLFPKLAGIIVGIISLLLLLQILNWRYKPTWEDERLFRTSQHQNPQEMPDLSIHSDMQSRPLSTVGLEGTINRGAISTQNNSPVLIRGTKQGNVINEGNISTGNGSVVQIGGSSE